MWLGFCKGMKRRRADLELARDEYIKKLSAILRRRVNKCEQERGLEPTSSKRE